MPVDTHRPAAEAGRIPAPTAVSMFSGRALWVSLALIVANLVIYAPVRLYPFINSDDGVYVTDNPFVLRGLSWSNVEPNFASGHNRLALALDRVGDHDGATKELAEVVRLMPNSAEAHANLAVSFAKQGKNAEAIEEFSQAVLLNPSDATSRGRLQYLRRLGTNKSTSP